MNTTDTAIRTAATVTAAFGMWIVAGLWHNLILPGLYAHTHATHDGIGLLLVSYVILAGFMVFLHPRITGNSGPVRGGLATGVIVGLLWVFPHGLAMAGAHGTSLAYVFKNAAWHAVEQGIGGVIAGLLLAKIEKRRKDAATGPDGPCVRRLDTGRGRDACRS